MNHSIARLAPLGDILYTQSNDGRVVAKLLRFTDREGFVYWRGVVHDIALDVVLHVIDCVRAKTLIRELQIQGFFKP